MNALVSFRFARTAAVALLIAACGDTDSDSSDPPAGTDGTDPVISGVTLGIDDPAARSCELLLSTPEGTLREVTFADTVEGRHIVEGDRAGLAFFQTSDGPFQAGAVALVIAGQSAAVKTATCFDGDGKPLADATVRVQE